MQTQKLKYTFLLFLIISTLIQAQKTDQQYNYDDYMKKYQRKYEGSQKQKHAKIFYEKVEQIQKLQKQGYDVEVNEFTDWSKQQLQKFLNYRPKKQDDSPTPRPLRASLLGAAPTSYDWRSTNKVTSVKNQGSCGACWAFVATAQYESQLAIQQSKIYDLAEQYLLQCEKVSSGCNFGYPYNALILANKTGIPIQRSYPYKGSSTFYSSTICTAPKSPIKLTKPMTDISHRINISISQLQQLLFQNGPISVAVDASSTQFMSSKGLISCPASNIVNHAVLLIGYNTTHWIVKNSWGTTWGSSGFAFIDKVNDCQLRQQVDIIYTNVNVPPPPAPGMVNLKVYMMDSGGDGWYGNVVGIRQNGTIIATFGSNFTAGSTKGPYQLQIPANIQTQIFLYQLTSFTFQMGFNLSTPSQPNLYTRPSGLNIPNNTIFLTFCPDPLLCPTSPTVTYYLTLTDTGNNGWGGNVLGFKSNGVIFYNFTLSTGGLDGPIPVVFSKYEKVEIVVVTLVIQVSSQTGFELKNQAGFVIASKANGIQLVSSSILGTFYPESTSISPLLASLPQQNQENQQLTTVSQNNQSKLQSYQISTYILASLCGLLIIVVTVLIIKMFRNKSKQSTSSNSAENASSKSGSQNQKLQINRIESCDNIKKENLDFQVENKIEKINQFEDGNNKNRI